MPLPAENVTWPPQQVMRAEWLALQDLYAGRTIGKEDVLNPRGDGNKWQRNVSSGIVADVASHIAALVHGDGFKATPVNEGDTDTAARLDEILDEGGLISQTLQGSEISSYMGGVFYRAVANPSLSSTPYVTSVEPLRVDPVWVDGFCVAATMWTEVAVSGITIFRWLENRDNRARTISNALYQGTASDLGKRIPLDSLAATAGLEAETNYPDGVDSMIWYSGGAYPNRRYTSSPHGRSDFQGVESTCVSVDSTMGLLARDERLAAARLVVPEGALTRSDGQPAYFNQSEEVFSELNWDTSDPSSRPELFQAQIRTTDFIAAMEAKVSRIISTAGFSPQSFGMGDYGTASGTALKVRENKTIASINAKRRLLTPVLASMLRNLLALDVAVFGTPNVNPQNVRIEWSEVVETDPLVLAQTIETLHRASAISTETAITMAQTPYTDFAEEVQRVKEEQGSTVTGLALDTQNTPVPPAN